MSYLSKRMKQIVGLDLKKKTEEFELTPLIEPTGEPVRMISRSPTKVIKESAEDGREIKDSGEPSSQARTSGDISEQTKKESRGGNTKFVRKLEESHPRFGPLYNVDQPSVKVIKGRAWEHVLKNSPEKNQSVTMEAYLKAIRKVEPEAKKIYGDKVSGIGSGFRWMMIQDGCFFLQLAFLILGYSDLLGYPQNDPIFSKKHNKKDMKMWIEALFFVGNQIPFVVVDELLKQDFFQGVINKVNLDYPSTGLCNKVLFELLVSPTDKRKQKMNIEPCDLLHGFQNLMLGPDPLGHSSVDPHKSDDDSIDLEANYEEDYFEGISTGSTGDEDDNGTSSPIDKLRKCLREIGLSDNSKRIFPCATELEREGISFKKLKNGGVRSIGFSRSYYFWASICLPVFLVDGNAEMIFQNLITYEMINQHGGKSEREASSYLRFMSDIIQTTKDVKLLQRKGIIQGDSYHAEKLPGILSTLVSSEDIRLTHELHNLRRKISDYSSPWIHYKILANLVVFLTLLQTFFALLAYFRPP